MVENTIKTKAIRSFKRAFPFIWKAGGFLLLLSLLGWTIFALKKDAFLGQIMQKAKLKLESNYGLVLGYQDVGFKGVRTIWIQDLQIDGRSEEAKKQNLPILFDLRYLEVKISLWDLLKGELALSSVSMKNLNLQADQQDSLTNYDRLSAKMRKTVSSSVDSLSKPASELQKSNQAFTDQFAWVWQRIQRFFPNDFEADQIQLQLTTDSTIQLFDIPKFDIQNGIVSGLVRLDGKDTWKISGELKLKRNHAFLEVVSLQNAIEIPYLKKNWNLGFSFDTLLFRLDDIRFNKNNPIQIQASSRVHGLKVQQPRLSGEPIVVPEATMLAHWKIDKDLLELGSGSVIQIQKAKLIPVIRLNRKPNMQYTFDLDIPIIPAQDFFDAIPSGLFTSLQGIRAQGKIGFKLTSFLDSEQLDSVRFESEMLQEGFRVNSWGLANPAVLNTSFLHEPYEETFQPSPFRVGPENPNFVPLDAISPYLKNAILTTEDPSFFHHHGFLIESFRESIATNYKEKAFKRGGSTISMQLIKNVFLHRNKTVVRKIEEMMLVWLMENPRIVSKERQYEVYLNIIEFGPGIYGIKSGANYYFAKHPAALNLGESLFLASIVPKPKRGMYYFDESGALKPYLQSYFTFIGQIMARRGLISVDETSDYGFSSVYLRNVRRPIPPIGLDSLDITLPDFNFKIPQE